MVVTHYALTVLRVSLGLPVTNSHNIRSAKLTFHIPHAGVLHGLAGYFEAVLYGKIGLSIHPHRKDRVSKDMLSWFPLFFPLKASSGCITMLCPPISK
jgi:type II protein arginine methyltransferase